MPIKVSPGFIEPYVRANADGVSVEEAEARIMAEIRRDNLFLRDGTLFRVSHYKEARQADIGGKPYALWYNKCMRCGGAGGWAGWPDFVCFRCGGNGWERNPTKQRLYTADEIDRLDAIADKRNATRAKKAAVVAQEAEERRQAHIACLQAESPLYARLKAANQENEFIASLVKRFEDGKELSSAQISAAERMFQRADEAAALKAKQQAGSGHVGTAGERVQFSGQVVGVVELGVSHYTGRMRRVVKILIDSGETLVWYTEASPPSKGYKITGKATVKSHSEYKGVAETIVQRVAID